MSNVKFYKLKSHCLAVIRKFHTLFHPVWYFRGTLEAVFLDKNKWKYQTNWNHTFLTIKQIYNKIIHINCSNTKT